MSFIVYQLYLLLYFKCELFDSRAPLLSYQKLTMLLISKVIISIKKPLGKILCVLALVECLEGVFPVIAY